MPKINDGSFNPDLDWSRVADMFRELEGASLIARMFVRGVVNGHTFPDERAQLELTRNLLNVALKSEELLAYVYPDDSIDPDLHSTLRTLLTALDE